MMDDIVRAKAVGDKIINKYAAKFWNYSAVPERYLDIETAFAAVRADLLADVARLVAALIKYRQIYFGDCSWESNPPCLSCSMSKVCAALAAFPETPEVEK